MLHALISTYFKVGQIVVRLPNGKTLGVNGACEADCPLVVHVTTNAAALAIARDPTLCAGEAYMDGGLVIERGTLYDFMDLVTRNLWLYRPRGVLHQLGQRWMQANDRIKSRKNVAHHYDLSGDLYNLFLDADRQYSCAYFTHPGMGLEDAQIAKKRHIAAKLLLEPDHKVLDIGSGWGGMGLTLAEEYGADVTGVTLSTEQLGVARERAAKRGMQGRARFELKDYRDVEGPYDRIVSVGMFEHVGRPNFQSYFDTVARLMKDDGVALIHTIGSTAGPSGNNAWIQKYIFPGGCIPALSELAPCIERAGLVVSDLEVLRIHYAETIKAWRERFAAHREEAKALYDERFCRMWEFYLAGAEAGFRVGSTVIYHLQLTKRNNVVPITRDYITDADRAAGHVESSRIAAE